MASTTLTFSDLVDETFSVLYRIVERPRMTEVGSTALANSTATSLTLADPDTVAVTDVLEFPDGEQVLVTGKSDLDVFTVSRGYNGTPATGGHATGDAVEVNPQWGRFEVDGWIRRFYDVNANVYLPMKETLVLYREPGDQVAIVPADVIDVVQVRAQGTSGQVADIAGWKFERDVPTAYYPTGQIVTLPSTISDDDELWVTVTAAYDTSGATIVVPVGTEDLAQLWAAAYAVGRREVSRLDLDAIQEWNQAAAIRNGQNLRLMQQLWGEFYRRLDEARKIHFVPKHRPYRKMPKIR